MRLRSKPKAARLSPSEPLRIGHIKTRLTGLGRGLLGVAAATYVAALNYSVNAAYALSFWMAGVLAWAWLQTMLQLHGCRVALQGCSEVFAGEECRARFSIRSKNRKTLRLHVGFWDGRSPNPALSRCEGRGQAEAVLAVRVERRGRNPLPPLVLYSQAPFAMAGAWALVDTGARVLAYAAPIEHEPPSSETGESEGKGMAKQGGEDVSHLAERVEGEPLAVAAWKQFAKTGKLLSKKMEKESGQTPSLISYRDYERVGDADFAAGCMTDRLLKAERDARRYVVELPNETIPEQLGQREKALAAIALM